MMKPILKSITTTDSVAATTVECIDVMISLQVKSMQKSALYLRDILEQKGLSVWLCVEMSGGDQYRTEIVHAIKTCKVFLPLINNAWALSGECEDEYR